MQPGNPNDPLLRQFLPVAEEDSEVPGFSHDPLVEAGASSVPGLLSKYRGRALLMVTSRCACACRYCFRRHHVVPSLESMGEGSLEAALAALAEQAETCEVILSGGDPLILEDARLAELAERLAAVGNLRRLRVHTRLPVLIPERVDAALLSWLTGTRLQPVVVLHANHGNEIDGAVAAAARRLRAAGVLVLHQAVLLRGINDSAEALAELSERLVEAGVLPYYLHVLDRVAGAAHFEVSEARARELIDALLELVPGYMVPRLVREVPGEPAKRPV
jgi:EF-P beta-lysylation protein EpmB